MAEEENEKEREKVEATTPEEAARKAADVIIKQLEKEIGDKPIPDELREKHLGHRNIKHVRRFIEQRREYYAKLFLTQCTRDLKLEMMEKGIIPRPSKLTLGQRDAKKAGMADYYNIDESTMMHLSKN
jgi:transcription elongation factor GreA-like protein